MLYLLKLHPGRREAGRGLSLLRGRRETCALLRALFCLAVLAFLRSSATSAQTYTPGTTYFGRSNYIQYVAGDMPVIFSAPHGGGLTPSEIPNRVCGSDPDCSTTTDSNVDDVALAVQKVFRNYFGHYAHVIVCNLKRSKLDCNRNQDDGAGTNVYAIQAWQEFQGFINSSSNNVISRNGRGFYVDLHGQGHAIERLELGYLLSSSQLMLSDSTLNSTTYENQSSIRTLSHSVPLTFSQLLRGTNSFGGLMEALGYPSVPSPTDPDPGSGNPYFDGGYNVQIHGSDNGGPLDGMQIEANYTGVRDTANNRTNYAIALAQVIDFFFTNYYGFNLRTSAPCLWIAGSGNWSSSGNWGGTVPVSGNYLEFAGPGGQVTNNVNNLTTGTGLVNWIVFDTNVSGAYTINGNAITLMRGVTNQSASTATINVPITLYSDQSFGAGSGNIIISGNITNGSNDLVLNCQSNITLNGVISGLGSVSKRGPGTLDINSVNTLGGPVFNYQGVISLNATCLLGGGLFAWSGGNILCENTRSTSPLINDIFMTADTSIYGDGTLTNSVRILPFSSSSISGNGGTLTIRNLGNNPGATNNAFRLRFTGGGFSFPRPIVIGHSNDLSSTVSQLESYNDASAGDQTYNGVISGAGQFRRDAANPFTAGRTILTAANTFTGGTTVNAGTLLVNNDAGSGTGAGPVVIATNGALGGFGAVAGPVTATGLISPGQSAGPLTLGAGLDLSAGGTYVWELSTNAVDGSGTNYDVIKLTGGNLVLGGTAKLSLNFIGAASAPATNAPFWQSAHTWTIISLTGSAANPGLSRFLTISNATYAAGSFTNSVDLSGNILLTYTPVPGPAPVIVPAIVGAGTSSSTISWSAVNGRTYEVQYKDDFANTGWTTLGTIVATNSTASFLDVTGPVPERFYRVVAP